MKLPSFENSPLPSLLFQGHFSEMPLFHEKTSREREKRYFL